MKSKNIFTVLFTFSVLFVSAQTGNWRLAGNTLAGTEKLGSLNSSDLKIITNNIQRVTIKGNNGRFGIGTSAPENTVHIFKGSAGTVTGYENAPLIIESSTHGYINLLAPDASETGILFGKPASNVSGGIIYNNSANLNGLQFRTNGNIARMSLTDIGNLGIGTTAPSRKLEVAGGDIRISRTISGARFLEFVSTATSQNDVRMEHSSAGSFFYFSSSSNDFSAFTDLARFDLLAAPTYVFTVYGNALASGGVWANSDAKLKKDVNDFKNAIDIIKQLKPRTYFYKKDEYKVMHLSPGKQYGFVAQEMEKVLPELVQTSQQPVSVNALGERKMEDVKAINYMQLIPILTQAIQEQEQKINEQNKKIEELNKLIGQLVARLTQQTLPDSAITQTSVKDVVKK